MYLANRSLIKRATVIEVKDFGIRLLVALGQKLSGVRAPLEVPGRRLQIEPPGIPTFAGHNKDRKEGTWVEIFSVAYAFIL